jgi:hypothetical protein
MRRHSQSAQREASVLVEFDAQLEFPGRQWRGGRRLAVGSIGPYGLRPLASQEVKPPRASVWSSQSAQPGRVAFKLRLTRRRSKTNASEESI